MKAEHPKVDAPRRGVHININKETGVVVTGNTATQVTFYHLGDSTPYPRDQHSMERRAFLRQYTPTEPFEFF